MALTSAAHLTCLCGAISVPGSLLSNTKIPISVQICHCNHCRHTTGGLGASFPPVNSAPPQDTLSKLTAYQSSHIVTRYFCSACGCHCFLFHHERKRWYSFGGIIERSPASQDNNIPWPEDTVKVSNHDYVLDTLDGGLTPILLNLNSRSIPTWSAAPQKAHQEDSFDLPHATVLDLPRKSIHTIPPPADDSYLTAKCHCGGVSLLIKRASYKTNSNYEVPATYLPADATKYLARLCACRSCRLSTGVSLMPWTFIPPKNIFNANTVTTVHDDSNPSADKPVPVIFGRHAASPSANPGLALKHHWSSPDVCRSFCSKCGATIFYWCDEVPEVVDFAVGILRAEEGSMGRRWLEWEWGKCSWSAECIDREVCEAWLGSAEAMKNIEG